MPIGGFSLSDFLKCFVEFAVEERGVKSLAPPYSPPWHVFLFNTRSILAQKGLPYMYFGPFDYEGHFPKSRELYLVMPSLEWVCFACLPDWRLMLYPEKIRVRTLPFIRDPVLEHTLDVAFTVAINVEGFLEF